MTLLHGLRANRLFMLARARVLAQQGFSVLLFDFQAHGESPGRRITGGKLEALDAAAAVRFTRERRPGERVGVIGMSLGGAAILLGPGPLDVDAVVLESVYPDIDRTLSNLFLANLGHGVGTLAAPVLVPLLDWLFLPTLGLRSSELRPIDGAAAVVAPALVMGGTEDALVPPEDTLALSRRLAHLGGSWLVEGAGHVDLERFAPEAYWAHVLPFLRRHLRQGGAVGVSGPGDAPSGPGDARQHAGL